MRLRWRRLDPDSRGLLRPRRDEGNLGRVSNQPAGAGWFGLATYGGLARTVADSALMLDVMHGTVAGDEYTTPAPGGTFLDAARTEPPAPLRIAVSRKLPLGALARLSADQRLAWEATARLLTELGHNVEDRDPDYGLVTLEFIQTYLRAVHEALGEFEEPWLAERSTRQLARIGGRLVSERRRDSVLAKRVRTTARIGRLFEQVDVLLTPGLASTAIAA